MIDLEQAITEWRRQMAAGGIKSPEVLAELEAHLREDIERRMRSGLAEQEAFDTASARIGPAGKLNAEFEKSDDAAEARARRLRFLGQLAPLIPALILFPIWLVKQAHGRLEITAAHWALAAAAIVVSFLLVPLGRKLGQRLPVVRNQLAMTLIILAVTGFFGLLFRFMWDFLPANDLDSLQVALIWTTSPWVAFGVCGSEWAQRCEASFKGCDTAATH